MMISVVLAFIIIVIQKENNEDLLLRKISSY